MRPPIVVSVSSWVAASRDDVWRSASSMAGVNFELSPLIRMTNPTGLETLPTDVETGEVLMHSWLLLFGFLPFDRHALALERVDVGSGFAEESTSWLQRRWRHERELTDQPDGTCLVTDRLTIEPRLAIVRPLVGPVVKQLFAHRHRRLANRFGAKPTPE